MLHSTLAFNMEMGMAVVLKVGENFNLPSAPANFPTCSNWFDNGQGRVLVLKIATVIANEN